MAESNHKVTAQVTVEGAEEAAKKLNYIQKAAQTFGTEVANKFAGMFAAAAVGKMAFDKLGEAMQKNIETSKQIAQHSSKFHIDPKEVSSLMLAANQAGVSVRSILMGMKQLGQVATKAISDSSKRTILTQLGIDADKLGEVAAKPALFLATISEGLARIDNDTDRTTAGTMLLGRQYQQMLPLIESLGASAEARASFLENENALTSEQVQANKDIAAMQDKMAENWEALVAMLSPYLLQLMLIVNTITEMIENVKMLGRAWDEWILKKGAEKVEGLNKDAAVLKKRAETGQLSKEEADDLAEAQKSGMSLDDWIASKTGDWGAWDVTKDVLHETWNQITPGNDQEPRNRELQMIAAKRREKAKPEYDALKARLDSGEITEDQYRDEYRALDERIVPRSKLVGGSKWRGIDENSLTDEERAGMKHDNLRAVDEKKHWQAVYRVGGSKATDKMAEEMKAKAAEAQKRNEAKMKEIEKRRGEAEAKWRRANGEEVYYDEESGTIKAGKQPDPLATAERISIEDPNKAKQEKAIKAADKRMRRSAGHTASMDEGVEKAERQLKEIEEDLAQTITDEDLEGKKAADEAAKEALARAEEAVDAAGELDPGEEKNKAVADAKEAEKTARAEYTKVHSEYAKIFTEVDGLRDRKIAAEKAVEKAKEAAYAKELKRLSDIRKDVEDYEQEMLGLKYKNMELDGKNAKEIAEEKFKDELALLERLREQEAQFEAEVANRIDSEGGEETETEIAQKKENRERVDAQRKKAESALYGLNIKNSGGYVSEMGKIGGGKAFGYGNDNPVNEIRKSNQYLQIIAKNTSSDGTTFSPAPALATFTDDRTPSNAAPTHPGLVPSRPDFIPSDIKPGDDMSPLPINWNR